MPSSLVVSTDHRYVASYSNTRSLPLSSSVAMKTPRDNLYQTTSAHQNFQPSKVDRGYSLEEQVTIAAVQRKRSTPNEPTTIVERKHSFIYNPTKELTCARSRYVSSILSLFGPKRDHSECWFHPLPPKAAVGGRSRNIGRIAKHFTWGKSTPKYRLQVNYGILVLLEKRAISSEQVDGFVSKGWHLSHLCGNWTCCNWTHFTVESAVLNVKRNGCLRDLGRRCTHYPQCLKELKQFPLPGLEKEMPSGKPHQ